eukprot:3912935-Ditylum_brightwellii.AAC.1
MGVQSFLMTSEGLTVPDRRMGLKRALHLIDARNAQTDLFSSTLGENLDTLGPVYGEETWQYIKNSI